MRAHKFVAEHGIEKAKEVLEGAPDNSFIYDLGQMKHVQYEDSSIAMCFLKNRFIDLQELKQVVESVEQINALGGLIEVKKILISIIETGNEYARLFEKPALEKAIADYEAVEALKENQHV